jgi:hypothetical protein
MNTLLVYQSLDGIRPEDLVSYLSLTGWKTVASEHWFVFQGASDIEGEPLEIVLPRNFALKGYSLPFRLKNRANRRL